MPFEIVSRDMERICADAIVRPIDPLSPQSGSIRAGCAALTPAAGLAAKYVIHTAAPVWNGGNAGEEDLLRRCYENSLRLAAEHGCRSIAFPLLCAEICGFPKDKALQAAVSAFSAFLPEQEMHIYLVVDRRSACKLSDTLFPGVALYLRENYVGAAKIKRSSARPQRGMDTCAGSLVLGDMRPMAPMAATKAASLEDMLKQEDAGFTETLLKLIDKTGKKDSEIYKKANISKQHFSKIRNNPHYRPTKATALAFAIALELDLEQTRDLIGRAGYALTNSSKFDLIIRYFIEQGNYNVVEINIALYEFDQNLLGA